MDTPAGALREHRLRLGLTQEQLARRVGVSFVTVNRWESGRSVPSAAARLRLTAVLEQGSPQSQGLPTYLDEFVGRKAQLEAVPASARLVTLTGPSGTGKTRLAVVAAGPAASYARVGGTDVLPQAGVVVVDAAGLPAAQAIPAVTTLLSYGAVRVIVAARTPLGLPGELIRPVLPLPLHDAEDLLRARVAEHQQPRPEQRQVLDDLAVASGGLPLAIEALAAWAGSLSLEQILARSAAILDPLATEAVEAATLDAATLAVLRDLAVFEGPFTLDAAAAVTGLPDDLELVRALRTLVHSGWLALDPAAGGYLVPRPWRRRLESDNAETRRRHAEHVLGEAVVAGGHLTGADQAPWRARLDASAADVEQALTWAAAHQTQAGLEAAAALWPWWLSGGRIAEGRTWVESFLADAGSAPESLLARGWVAAAVLAAENGDHTTALSLATRASRAFQALGDKPRRALAEGVLGSAYRYLGRRPEARTHFEQALALRDELGDRRAVATSLNNLALLALDDGDLARARQMLERSLAAKRQLAEPRSVAIGLCNLAHTLLRLDLTDDALVALAEAQSIAHDVGDGQLTGTVAANQGDAHLAGGSYSAARHDFERAFAAYDGHPHDQVVALCGRARALDGLGLPAEALETLRSAESLAERTGSEHRMNEVRATLAQLHGVPRSPPPGSLTRRQAEVLGCLADGRSNREIAALLHLSPSTVERHLASAYAKLGLRNRVEAARYAMQHGLLSPP